MSGIACAQKWNAVDVFHTANEMSLPLLLQRHHCVCLVRTHQHGSVNSKQPSIHTLNDFIWQLSQQKIWKFEWRNFEIASLRCKCGKLMPCLPSYNTLLYLDFPTSWNIQIQMKWISLKNLWNETKLMRHFDGKPIRSWAFEVTF